MANIDEIFNSMPAPAAEVEYEYLTLDTSTLQIIIPESEKIFGVENDSLTERKYFSFPRYVGQNVDLAACFLQAVFQNANGEKDRYIIQDAAVQGENITFSWEFTRKVTKYRGQTQFLICASFPGNNGVFPEWHTTLAAGNVLQGLEHDASDAEAETADVISQLLAIVAAQSDNVEAVGAAQVQAVQTEGSTQVQAVETAAATAEAAALQEIEGKKTNVLAAIPDDYTAMGNAVDMLTRTTAGAIVCTAAGETIRVHDSSDHLLPGLRIFGKTEQVKTTGAQLLPIADTATKTDRGLTQTVKDGACIVRGTANSTAAFNLTICGSYYGTEPIFTLQPGTYTVHDCMLVSATGGTQIKYQDTTFTLTDPLGITWVATRSYNPGEVVAETTHPMLNAGSTALPWELYTGGAPSPSPAYPQELKTLEAPVVGVYGKNLVNANNLLLTANTSLVVSPDGYTVTATGGGSNAYVSSYLMLPVDQLRGKTVIIQADSITSEQPDAHATVQLNIVTPAGTTYHAIDGGTLSISRYIAPDATELRFGVYTNNTAAALATDNTVVVKGLMVSLDGGEWEAYTGGSISLTDDLPGIPVTSGGNYTDATGQQWICDEVDLGRGVYVQRVAKRVLTGGTGEQWGAYNPGGGENVFHCYLVMSNYARRWPTTLCDKFRNVASVWERQEYGEFSDYNTSDLLYFSAPNAEVTDMDTMKAWLQENPVTLIYLLATPTERALSNSELAAFAATHSCKPETLLLNDAGAYMALDYVADTKTYIDNKFAALSAAITQGGTA